MDRVGPHAPKEASKPSNDTAAETRVMPLLLRGTVKKRGQVASGRTSARGDRQELRKRLRGHSCGTVSRMSVSRIRELLRLLAGDERISVAEVKALIDAANDEGVVSPGEAFFLEGALSAYRPQFEPEAYRKLAEFLKTAPRS